MRDTTQCHRSNKVSITQSKASSCKQASMTSARDHCKDKKKILLDAPLNETLQKKKKKKIGQSSSYGLVILGAK